MSAEPISRGPYAKSKGQRRRILDVAVDVFGRFGGRGGSLKDIADRVGMSQAGVLHHFGSKNDLLLAVLERRDDQGRVLTPDATLEEGVEAARELLEEGNRNPGLFQLHVTLSAEATDPAHPAHEFFVERYARVSEQFTAPLRAAARDGRLSDDADPEAIAHLVMAAMDGLQLHMLLNDDVDVLKSFDVLMDAVASKYIRPDEG
ncbi:TetR/AcrR family transcriptional regulator [Luteipulveratus mongoliensis]|uniref:HTH tetR-type domain-containing protein n=1 Tax=Luteipulveratus mongoliensis TaxID=571913 RepID=A0A0K1JFJ9_9MICO|nr:TetR/AcrR family transcriptional regulator [Luteipulveratus mongoliensis]AKU15484.1 hypothetical protein VV02_05740 [Luteipulveratus mongoliensis]